MAQDALDGQATLPLSPLDQDGRADGEVVVLRRHALRRQRALVRPIALQQADEVHPLIFIVLAGDQRPIAPIGLALQLPTKGRLSLALRVGDARLAQRRLDDVLIEAARKEDDVRGDARSMALRKPDAHHVGHAKDQSEGQDAHGGGKHDQERAELVAPQIAPHFTPDGAHR